MLLGVSIHSTRGPPDRDMHALMPHKYMSTQPIELPYPSPRCSLGCRPRHMEAHLMQEAQPAIGTDRPQPQPSVRAGRRNQAPSGTRGLPGAPENIGAGGASRHGLYAWYGAQVKGEKPHPKQNLIMSRGPRLLHEPNSTDLARFTFGSQAAACSAGCICLLNQPTALHVPHKQ